ncbi:hypothetical protein L596_019473 [Steinernema carpocapsae]|uniref:G-protein coupled receptors family 1 profile domain-containing protein n=1 Tax=Steinernema carpocapsae TaxID=34508 RepID=A0A4V6A0L1_STECR|nr:hypothetical protein L596_019473 [Steinernema carpocapsae]
MEDARLTVGICYVVIPTILLPAFVRILYIFVSKKKYRSLECYRIMIQMGIAQCGGVVPAYVGFGLCLLLNDDSTGIFSLLCKFFIVGFRVEVCLNLVLALNRLKIICNLKYSDYFHTVLICVSWLLGLGLLAAMFAPCCTVTFRPNNFAVMYESVPAFQRFCSSLILIPPIFTFIVYIFLVFHLLKMKFTGLNSDLPSLKQEIPILIYAFVRFTFDFTFAFIYHYGNLPPTPLNKALITAGIAVSNTVVPPVLYLILHKELRRELWPFCGSKTKVSTVVPVVRSLRKKSTDPVLNESTAVMIHGELFFDASIT